MYTHIYMYWPPNQAHSSCILFPAVLSSLLEVFKLLRHFWSSVEAQGTDRSGKIGVNHVESRFGASHVLVGLVRLVFRLHRKTSSVYWTLSTWAKVRNIQ